MKETKKLITTWESWEREKLESSKGLERIEKVKKIKSSTWKSQTMRQFSKLKTDVWRLWRWQNLLLFFPFISHALHPSTFGLMWTFRELHKKSWRWIWFHFITMCLQQWEEVKSIDRHTHIAMISHTICMEFAMTMKKRKNTETKFMFMKA